MAIRNQNDIEKTRDLTNLNLSFSVGGALRKIISDDA